MTFKYEIYLTHIIVYSHITVVERLKITMYAFIRSVNMRFTS